MKKNIILLLFILLSPFTLFGQDNVINDVSASFKSGYIEVLRSHLSDQTKVFIYNNDNTYSKQETIGVISDFFCKNKPISYEIVHQGNKNDAIFVIGNLKTTNGTYRIFYLIKNSKIQQLRIENN